MLPISASKLSWHYSLMPNLMWRQRHENPDAFHPPNRPIGRCRRETAGPMPSTPPA
jgi:hypothetical protein